MEFEGAATICVGTDLASSKRAIEIAEMSPNIWATIGQHPTDTDEDFDITTYEEMAKHPRVVAIGECGFDFFRTPKESRTTDGQTVFKKQKELFLKQITLAEKTGKPLMIHARPSKGMTPDGIVNMDAYEDTLNILSNFPQVRANFHFFVGDTTIAQKALDAHHTMSFDGPITFSRDYDEVIKMLPLESIMAETDSPFAAPEPYRKNDRTGMSGRAEPWMVKEVVKTIAKIKGMDDEIGEEKVRQAMLNNAKQFFRILL
ncbi:MAG: hypothetical protein RL641_126 [Candidatus Parcubacteria bacterium]